MSSAVIFSVLAVLVHSVWCTVFPPVSNSPPIPASAVRAYSELSGQQYYVQDDIQLNSPQPVIKEEGYFSLPADTKPEDQWFVSENESATGDFPTSSETFERLYSNGLPAIGPVATPAPDDNYLAQQSGTSKVFPESPGSGLVVLTKGPNDQLVQERWVQVPAERVEVVNPEVSPKILSETVKSPNTPLFPVKSGSTAVGPSNFVRQVWIRVPASVALQKGALSSATIVDESPSPKQILDAPQTIIKGSFQPQIVREFQPQPQIIKNTQTQPQIVKGFQPQPQIIKDYQPPPPPPPPVVQKKSSGFIVPPPPPPPLKSIDLQSPKQTLVVSEPEVPFVDKGNVAFSKSPVFQQVKHIWVPTSAQTGKFITMPVGSLVNSGKSVISKGAPVDSAPPITVSETWVLKQDGLVPRFEQQKSVFPPQVAPKGSVVVEEPAVVQLDSPKNPSFIGKSIDAPIPADIWPQRNDPLGRKTLEKVVSAQPGSPLIAVKSDSIVVGKSAQIPALPPQKSYNKGKLMQPLSPKSPFLPPPPPPTTIVKGKPPCPILPQKMPISPKVFPYPAYRSITPFKRQPVARIIRVNRYPFGSYYLLNPRMRPNLYAYPRPAAIVQKLSNGMVRTISTGQIPFPLAQKQVALSAPVRHVSFPVTTRKLTPKFLYPPVQAINRVRYALPWGSYLSALPAPAPVKKTSSRSAKKTKKPKRKKESSSSSSSSESKSESKAKSSSSDSKESEEVAESIETTASLSPEPEPEPETEPEPEPEPEVQSAPEASSSVQSDVESEAIEATEPEATESLPQPPNSDSLEADESQLGFAPQNSYGNPAVRFGYDQQAVLNRPQEEVSEFGRGVGNYGFGNMGRFYTNGAFIPRGFLPNDPRAINYGNGNPSFNNRPDPVTRDNMFESATQSTLRENVPFNFQRD